jgi:hypothetical protein
VILSDFEQEPGSTLGLVDPGLDAAGRGDVAVPVAEFMDGTH